jgi:opacity protein-like surface antigen
MSRALKVMILLAILPLVSVNLAQERSSFQINGGIVSPRSSSKGFAAGFEYNYAFNQRFTLYLSAGYIGWDKFNITFMGEQNRPEDKQIFSTYSSDAHELIPIYAGVKINLHKNKYFSSFLNFEAGYSYFSYNSYSNIRVVDNVTGQTLAYEADLNSRTKVKENLFGIGLGGGLSHPLTENINLILQYKLNSNFNSGEFGLFSAKGTYYTLSLGLNLGLTTNG